MMSKVLCVYHAGCADGLGAAWAVHKALGPDVEFVSAKYGDLPPRESCPVCNGTGAGDYSCSAGCTDCLGTGFLGPLHLNRNVLIVDFSYPLDVLRAMAAEARSVLVLDHHKTAQEDLQNPAVICLDDLSASKERSSDSMISSNQVTGASRWSRTVGNSGISQPLMNFSNWIDYCGDELRGDDSNLAAIFDMDRSGAGLTWDYLHPGVSRPRIIDLIEDRDLWKFKFGDESRAFHAVLASYDWTDLPGMFQFLNECSFGNEIVDPNKARAIATQEGYAILRAQQQAAAAAVAASRRTIKIADHVVPCANVPPSMASDAGHLLCQQDWLAGWFSATYYDGSDGRRHFSLRSPSGGADVGQIAKGVAEHFNWLVAENFKDFHYEWSGTFAGGGHAHAAGFDAPLGWEGE